MCMRMKMLCERDMKGLTVRLLKIPSYRMRGLFRRIQSFHLSKILKGYGNMYKSGTGGTLRNQATKIDGDSRC